MPVDADTQSRVRERKPGSRAAGTAIIDSLKEGVARNGEDGWTVIRTALVSGLTGRPWKKVIDAHYVRGMPRKGSIHPSIPFLPLAEVSSSMLPGETDKAVVTLTYRFASSTDSNLFNNDPSETAAPQIEVDTTLQQVATNFDVNSNLMKVAYDVPIIDPETGEPTGETKLTDQVGEASVMVPLTTLRYMRREPVNPYAKAKLYVGRTNSVKILGDDPHYWLCTRIGGSSDDGGITYNVTYEFQRGEPHKIPGTNIELSGWYTAIVYIDPETGKPPPDVVVGVGLKTYPAYPAANFFDLNLTSS